VGRLSSAIASAYKFRQPVYVAELNLEAVLSIPTDPTNYQPLPRFPGVVRDVSFVTNKSINYDAIREALKSQNADILQSIEFIDVYEGKGLAEDERSITIRLEYRSDERTLVEDEVDDLHRRLIEAVIARHGVRVRS
jgi:phenylalanyl-tRNA synthetase beta chain